MYNFLWFISSFVAVILFVIYNDFSLFSLSYIHETGIYPYIVLFMCILMIYLKKDKIIAKMPKKNNCVNIVSGIFLIYISILLTSNEPKIIFFSLFLLLIGLFTIFFGKAAIILIILVGIYGFSIMFPYVFPDFYPKTISILLVSLMSIFIPIISDGITIYFISSSGENYTYLIDIGCSGGTSLSLFLSLFFLMMIDKPLQYDKIGYILIFGIIGTLFQNFLRLVILILSGYFYGIKALWLAHDYVGYILFPIWFYFFAYVYFKNQI